MRLLIGLGLCSLVALASAQDPFAIRWSEYRSGVNAKITRQRESVINNEAEFQKFWMELTGESASATPRDVRWGEEMLVAITLGERPGTGYRVRVISVERETPAVVMVRYAEVAPRGKVPEGKSTPWVLIRMNRPGGNLMFQKTEIEYTDPGGPLPPDKPAKFEFRTYLTEPDSRIQRASGMTIHTAEEFARYWFTLRGDRSAPNDVDWRTETLVAIHIGRRESSGYDVWVESVRFLERGLLVRYVERRPSPDQRVKRESTSPYVIIRVPRFTGEAQFEGRVWNGDSQR